MQDGKYVILCVDDDPSITDWMHIVLEGAGYVVVDASTAEEGKQKYQETEPDLVIVDLMMEEVDSGTNLVKELKALGSTPPIYMLSSVGDELSQTADPSEIGLDGIFQKPIDPDILLTVLQTKLRD